MATSNSSTVVVNIFGKNYPIVLGPGQTAEQVRQVAQLVDAGMRSVKQAYNPPFPQHTAVLAGLNLVDELFRLQSDYQAAESDIEQRASRLNASLGRLFAENPVDRLGSDQS